MNGAPKILRPYVAGAQRSESSNPLPDALKPGKRVRLGVISNPLSGGNRRGLSAVRAALENCPQADHFEASTPSEVGSALAELARREVDVVTINGGDGTIHAVLTELFRRQVPGPFPVLAVLRSGTTSLIARDVGLIGSRQRALRRLLTWVNTGNGMPAIVQRPILKVEKVPHREPLYGMFFGMAGICQGIQYFHTHLNTRGLGGELAAGLTMMRFLLAAVRGHKRLFPEPITVGLEGESPEKQDFLLILISTLERLFFGLRPYWGAEVAPLYYTALSARPQHLLRALPQLLRGRKSRFSTKKHGYTSLNIREARLALTGNFALDGELYSVDNRFEHVTVKEGGKALFLRL
jgi:diacylglycerol kinase (ATP)